MPMRPLPTRLNELDAAAYIVVICHHGVRSLQVGAFLERQGFSAIYNLSGGSMRGQTMLNRPCTSTESELASCP